MITEVRMIYAVRKNETVSLSVNMRNEIFRVLKAMVLFIIVFKSFMKTTEKKRKISKRG